MPDIEFPTSAGSAPGYLAAPPAEHGQQPLSYRSGGAVIVTDIATQRMDERMDERMDGNP